MNPMKVAVHSEEARVSKMPGALSDDYRNKLGQNLDLSEDQRKRLKAWLKERIEEWRTDTADLHARLLDDNDLVDGIIMETDWPWDGAPNVHVPVTEMYMDIFWSVQKRSILGANLIWSAETDDDMLRDVCDQVAEAIDYKARNEWGVEEALEAVFYTTNRDGLGILKGTWEEDYRPAKDVIIIDGLDEFFMEFPTPEDGGMDLQAWADLAQYVIENATPETPVEIPISFEKQIFSGVRAEVVELVDFVMIPAACPSIRHRNRRGYGMRYRPRKAEILQKGKDGVFYQDAAKRLFKDDKGWTVNEWTQAIDDIQGVQRTNTKDERELFELAVIGCLDGDEGEEAEYLVTYSLDCDELLQCMDYPFRCEMMAEFRIDPRPNRLVGRSIPVKTRDMNDEIDTQHNQRLAGWAIANVPSFKALKGQKEDLDPMLQSNRWKPGVIFWLSQFDSFEQFTVQPTDQGESMQQERQNMTTLDLYLGSPSAVMSGAAAPSDPSAPGNKHAMMIQQGNLRLDSMLTSLRHGVGWFGDICVSHTYQFGPAIMEYQSQVEEANGIRRETRTLMKKYLRRGLKMKMNGITVISNPDVEMQKGFQLYGTLLQEPMLMQYTPGRVALLRDTLKKGRVDGRDKYLPDEATVQQFMVETQKQALLQLKQEQESAQQTQVKENVAGAKDDLKIRKTAEQMADAKLGI